MQSEGLYRDTCRKCGARRIDAQLGLEATPEEFITNMAGVFREVKRVLADDGTLWVNIGDSYASPCTGYNPTAPSNVKRQNGEWSGAFHAASTERLAARGRTSRMAPGLKPKDLVGIPWRLAFALQADGWYLRSDIIWHKPNPMPESVTDRPGKAHEYLFLLSKRAKYYYDAEAVKEPSVDAVGVSRGGSLSRFGRTETLISANAHRGDKEYASSGTRNRRTVWTIATAPFKGAHFATYPPKLVEPCILAGSRPGDVVLDPFAGSGTTGMVAENLGRKFIGIELNADYSALAREAA